MLRKIGNFNDFDSSLRPKMPENGTIVSYKFKYQYTDPIPKNSSGQIRTTHQYMVKLPKFSYFWDKTKNDGQGAFIKIGLIDEVDQQTGEIKKAQSVWAKPQENFGLFTLTIGNPSDNRLYEYLEMCSFVEHEDPDFIYNPEEDKIMVRVDNEKEATRQRDKRTKRREAVNAAATMSEMEIERTAYLLGFDVNNIISTLRNEVEDWAETNPEKFIALIKDEDSDVKSTINQAISLGCVFVDAETSNLRIKETNAVIMSLNGVSDIQNQFANYLRDPGNKNSEALLKTIKLLIETSVKRKKPGRPAATA